MFFRDGNVWSSHHRHLLDCDFFDQMENDSMTPWAKSDNNPHQVQSPPRSLRAKNINNMDKVLSSSVDSRSGGKSLKERQRKNTLDNSSSNKNKNGRKDSATSPRKRKKSFDAAVSKMNKRFKTRPLVLGNWRIGEGENRWILIKYVSKSFARYKEERMKMLNQQKKSQHTSSSNASPGLNSNSNSLPQGQKRRDSMDNDGKENITENENKNSEMIKEEVKEKRRLFSENIENAGMDWELRMEEKFSKLVFMVSPTGKLWTCCGGGGWLNKGTSADVKFKNHYQSLDKKVAFSLPCM